MHGKYSRREQSGCKAEIEPMILPECIVMNTMNSLELSEYFGI